MVTRASWLPTARQISQEAGAVIVGAVLAAAFFAYLAPNLGRWTAANLPTGGGVIPIPEDSA